MAEGHQYLLDQCKPEFEELIGGIGIQGRHHGSPARIDRDQVPTLQNQQGLADRTAADVEFGRNAQFLDALSGGHFSQDDAFAQKAGDLLGQRVVRLECHCVIP